MLTEIPDVEIAGQAGNAPDALAGVGELKPDVVILDIRMPGGSGIDVLRKLKKDRPALTVIMLTKYAYPQYRERCLALGADFFLDKATDFDRIPEILNRLSEDSPTSTTIGR